jgi:hypothetical protein
MSLSKNKIQHHHVVFLTLDNSTNINDYAIFVEASESVYSLLLKPPIFTAAFE